MRRMLALVTLALLVAQTAPADEEFDQLVKSFEQAQRAWYKELQKHRKPDGSIDWEAEDLPPVPQETFLPKFRAYAEKHAGKPAAIPALVWILNEGAGDMPGEPASDTRWALDQLIKNHAADPALRDQMFELGYTHYIVGKAPLVKFYDKVIKTNPDRQTVAGALFNLASIYYAESIDEKDKLHNPKKAAELFRKVVKEYGDTPVAKWAAGYVYEIEHLQVGMKAPDFEGQDVDGNTIRLSQFRGQVVVLDFWGFW